MANNSALTFPTDTIEDVRAQLARMRAHFDSGATLPLETRRAALLELRSWLKSHEDEVMAALHDDLGKAPFEAYATELGIVYDDIRHCLSHMGRWAKPKRVATPIVHFRSRSLVYPSPLGVVLVMSPWNYPLQLALVPLVEAIAAG
ncbi:MAG: aldehyde dehydrogenase family protein, partial [Eggerthellaceae bacterium]|nr:aldehyde dehydrogenase family protein [Eggerthellaceae bacterium]